MLPVPQHTKPNLTQSTGFLMKRNVYSFVPLVLLYILIFDFTLKYLSHLLFMERCTETSQVSDLQVFHPLSLSINMENFLARCKAGLYHHLLMTACLILLPLLYVLVQYTYFGLLA